MAASKALVPFEAWLSRHRAEVARRPRLRRLAFGVWGSVHPAGMPPEACLGFLEGSGMATDTRTARRALIAERCREELELLERPALLVWGARDRLVPLEVGFEYARRLRAPLRTVPAAGHLVIGEYPDECVVLLEEFLRDSM
jgi:pimeloyl-ACP methyl ester carboxylesterase